MERSISSLCGELLNICKAPLHTSLSGCFSPTQQDDLCVWGAPGSRAGHHLTYGSEIFFFWRGLRYDFPKTAMRSRAGWKKRVEGSEVMVPPEPLDLRAGIAVNDIALLILERPGDHDQDVPFADPDLLFYLPLDPAHPGHPVKAADPDMVCAHHQFGTPEHLTVPFLGQLDPDDLVARRCTRFVVCQYNLSCAE